jgi:hypothetical protein
MLICLAECFYHTDYHQKNLHGEDIISIRFVLSGDFTVDFLGIGNSPSRRPARPSPMLRMSYSGTRRASSPKQNHLN